MRRDDQTIIRAKYMVVAWLKKQLVTENVGIDVERYAHLVFTQRCYGPCNRECYIHNDANA